MDILHDVIVLRTRLDVICFTRRMYPLCLWVLNPDTGITIALPYRQMKLRPREER
uniref:Uncharacterized protein n=1 Tax=Leersia perrieri TaxID=77586 RepID=A0A0D9WWJ2_9ORYZ